MENLHKPATANQPQVDFLVKESLLTISGSSIMEEAKAYYTDLINWVKDFTQVISKETTVEIALSELNQLSLKMLLFFCQEVKALEMSGNIVNVNWSYPEDNLALKEAGQDLSYLADLEFNFKAVKLVEEELA